jgi:hypothetical protein
MPQIGKLLSGHGSQVRPRKALRNTCGFSASHVKPKIQKDALEDREGCPYKEHRSGQEK